MIEWGAQKLYQAVESLGDAIDKNGRRKPASCFKQW